LINGLTSIKDNIDWGAPFRFGTLQIFEQNLRLIVVRMMIDQGLLKGWKTLQRIPFLLWERAGSGRERNPSRDMKTELVMM